MAANLDLFSRLVKIAVVSRAGEEGEQTQTRSRADGRMEGKGYEVEEEAKSC